MRGMVVIALLLAGLGVVDAGADESVTSPANPVFYKDIVPILQENCQQCHRPGGANLGGMVAPMALITYEETRPWAKAIAKNVAARKMPPWHASPEQSGHFRNERTLTQTEIDTILNWVKTGARPGNPADAPAPLEWDTSSEWSIGKPDLIVSMPEDYFVADDVEDIYVQLNTEITEEMLPEERFIKAIEFRPGSSVVHHIIATPLGGIAPGNDPTVYPDGIGQRLSPGMTVSWQMHYHKEPGPGTGMSDRSSAGIKFYPKDAEVTHVLKGDPLGRFDFAIPPGAKDYSISSEMTFAHDTEIVSFMPHMHLRGKSAKYEAYYPDGRHEVLLEVPEYDFNWQTSYAYKDFKKVPAGTKVVFTSVWDNSEDNPYNPDPTQRVTFGQPTTDEMSFGFMSFIDESGEERSMFGGGRRGGGRRGGFNLVEMISRLDADGDGKLQESEAPGPLKRFFNMMDANGDGGIDEEEAKVAAERMREMRRGQ